MGRKKLSRREFLELAGVAAGAVLIEGCGEDGGGAVGDPNPDPGPGAMNPDMNPDLNPGMGPGMEPDMGPDAQPDMNPDLPPDDRTPLGIVGPMEINAQVSRAIELAGGLDTIRTGDTVFIKPNAVHGFVTDRPGIVTSNAVLAAVIRHIKEYSPGKIIVGDRPARSYESATVLTQTGHRQAALDAGADEIHAPARPSENPDDWVLLQPPNFEETWAEQGGVLAMRQIVEADHFINLPVCKDHRWAVFSLSLKNLIGAIGDDSRDPMHYIREMPDQLSRDIVILNGAFSPTMNILDARAALINGGPEGAGRDTVRTAPNLVMASTDRLAIDAMGVALIQLELSRNEVPIPDEAHAFLKAHGPWRCPQLIHGVALGLGVAGPSEVALRFDTVSDQAALTELFRTT